MLFYISKYASALSTRQRKINFFDINMRHTVITRVHRNSIR